MPFIYSEVNFWRISMQEWLLNLEKETDPRKRSALLIEPNRHIMCSAAYESPEKRPNNFSFYVYMPSFSDIDCATYRKIDGSEWVMAIRGTSSGADIGHCIRHLLGIGIGDTARYLRALDLAKNIQNEANKEGASVKLTGHSLGGLIAAKINVDLFGGTAQTVLFSPAAQLFDEDTFTVYSHQNTFIIAKPDDVVSTFCFIIAPKNSFISELPYLHKLGEAEYHAEDPFTESGISKEYTPGQVMNLLDEGQRFATHFILDRISFLGKTALGYALNALKHYYEKKASGEEISPEAALEYAKQFDGLIPMDNSLLSFLLKKFSQIYISLATDFFKLTFSPIGTLITSVLGKGEEATKHEKTIVYKSLFHAPNPPLIACAPPNAEHFEKYDPIGGIKPLK